MDKDWMSPPDDLVREKVPSYDDSCGLCLYGIEPEISQAAHTHSLRSKTLRPEVSESDMHKNAEAIYTSIQPHGRHVSYDFGLAHQSTHWFANSSSQA
jgi:hypothetical protein